MTASSAARCRTPPNASWRWLALSKDEAQNKICRAIADGVLKFRKPPRLSASTGCRSSGAVTM
jgi:hypothetical protein